MAKRTAQNKNKSFNFDIESLLLSDVSQEEKNDVQVMSPESCNRPKKFKSKDSKTTTSSNKIKCHLTSSSLNENMSLKNNGVDDDVEDVTKFFEDVGNDINKSIQTKKMRLGQFTDSVISLYQKKVAEMVKIQEEEVENFKKQTVTNIQEEMNKCEEETKKLRLQECKIMKILEQQLKILQKTSAVQTQWMKKFADLHNNFIQAYEELKTKHKNEALNLKKSLNGDVLVLQDKFLMEAKKEEMHTMKKYLSSVYF